VNERRIDDKRKQNRHSPGFGLTSGDRIVAQARRLPHFFLPDIHPLVHWADHWTVVREIERLLEFYQV
jgi:hypothetical protein